MVNAAPPLWWRGAAIGFFLIAPPGTKIYGPPQKVMAPPFIAPLEKNMAHPLIFMAPGHNNNNLIFFRINIERQIVESKLSILEKMFPGPIKPE